jgi:hypothetical protein
MSTIAYPRRGDLGIESRVERAVRSLCHARKTAPSLNKKRVMLNDKIVDELVQLMVRATWHAASRPTIKNRTRRRGAPADNSRIILADDVRIACSNLGISPGLRYSPPESFAVALFLVVARIIWPGGGRNPRKTFERLRAAVITRN